MAEGEGFEPPRPLRTYPALFGGSERIRTSETLAGLPDFKSGPIDHSGTLPYGLYNIFGHCSIKEPVAALRFVAGYSGTLP